MTSQLKSKFTKNGAKKSKGVIHEGSPIILTAAKARYITGFNNNRKCIVDGVLALLVKNAHIRHIKPGIL